MKELVEHWQVIVSIVALIVYAVRVEVEVKHLKRDMEIAEVRHVRCVGERCAKENEVATTLTSIQVMVARIDQRLTDLFNAKGLQPRKE